MRGRRWERESKDERGGGGVRMRGRSWESTDERAEVGE